MKTRTIWILGIAYAVTSIILHYFFETTIGALMMTVSFFAFVVAIIGVIYYLIKFIIKQFNHHRSN